MKHCCPEHQKAKALYFSQSLGLLGKKQQSEFVLYLVNDWQVI